MDENNINDIQIVKIKRIQNNGDKFEMDNKKRNGIDSVSKLTQRNTVINEIEITSNQINSKNKKSKKKKNANIRKNINQTNSFEILKSSLADISEMIIKQEADILEAVTGCQEPNNYNIYGKLPNGEIISIFKCREYSGCLMRCFCPVNCREFSMRIKLTFAEKDNEEDEEYESRVIDVNKDCKCPFLCCIRPDMVIILTQFNNKLGRIEQSFSFCDPVFRIFNKDDKEIFYIEADCCQCGLMCRNNFMGKTDEAHFFIYNVNDRDNPSGDICKKAAKSMLSIGDNYSVIFPLKASIEEKILLTIAGIMIDYQYFEKNANSR